MAAEVVATQRGPVPLGPKARTTASSSEHYAQRSL